MTQTAAVVHDLKVWPEFFQSIWTATKRFEVRDRSDRTFNRLDKVLLREWSNRAPGPLFPSVPEGYSGRAVYGTIIYVLDGGGPLGLLPANLCVFGFNVLRAFNNASPALIKETLGIDIAHGGARKDEQKSGRDIPEDTDEFDVNMSHNPAAVFCSLCGESLAKLVGNHACSSTGGARKQ